MDKIKRKVIIFVVLFALGFGVYQYFRPYDPSPQTLTSSQQVAMNKINAEMKPYCAGRYMLDLPSSFTAYNDAAPLDNNIWAAVISRPEDIYKTYLATKKMYHPAFVQLIALREKALQNSKTIDARDMPFLKKSGRYPLVWMVLFLNGMKTEVLRTQCASWKDISIPMVWLSSFRSKRSMIQLHVMKDNAMAIQFKIMSQVMSAR